MTKNVVNAKEVGFSIAEILGEATEEPGEAEEFQEKAADTEANEVQER